jgi:uncharacterized protein (TIGR03435 family)
MRSRIETLFLGIVMIAAAAIRLQSQPPTAQKPSFDVASIKANTLGPGGGPPRVASDIGRFIANNAPLKVLLQFAYRPMDGRTLRFNDIFGAPDWTDTDRFDIEAKTEGGVPQTPPEQMRLMAQTLLVDRFQLKTHWETREMPTYNIASDLIPRSKRKTKKLAG